MAQGRDAGEQGPSIAVGDRRVVVAIWGDGARRRQRRRVDEA